MRSLLGGIPEGRHWWQTALSGGFECVRCHLYVTRSQRNKKQPRCEWRHPDLHPEHQLHWTSLRLYYLGGQMPRDVARQRLRGWARRKGPVPFRLGRQFLRCGFPWETGRPETWGPRQWGDVDWGGIR